MKVSTVRSWKRSFLPLFGMLTFVLFGHLETQPRWLGVEAAYSQEPEAEGKTLSPYFFVESDDPTIDQLPLKSTSAVVNIAGVISDVTVTQVYRNEGQKTIEAIYIFPASTRAAVHGMKMSIGERTITARIHKREDARQAYEKARQEGKSASLLEQQRPNVFQMNVANILPGDEIKTELRYTELLVPTDGIYQFVYPTVVGPRYSNAINATAARAPASEGWSRNPYLHQGEPPLNTFDIRVNLSAGLPIQEVSCPSHKANVSYEEKDRARIELDPSEQSGGNRDFILKYRLSGSQIESGLLLFEGQEENFFLLMLQPPKRISQADIPPREYIFIVDVSGSMHGYPLDITKKLMKDLIGGLNPGDTFNVLLFSGGSQLLSERSLPADSPNIRRALDLIERQQGGGSTELLPAMKRALALPATAGVSRTLIIATDGYITVEPEAFELIRNHIGDANFFAFGIGSSVNRFLIEGIARVGAGESFIVTKPDDAPAHAGKFRRYVQSPLLTRVRLDFGSFEVYDVEPTGVPDIFAERPAIVFGKWKGNPRRSIKISGIGGGGKYEKTFNTADARPMPENSALRYLWARSRIAELSDYNKLRSSDERIEKVTELGLKYNLLTAYTSFVAIDTAVRRRGEDPTVVQQPLPLPQGVSDYAVANEARIVIGKSHAAGPPAGLLDQAPRSKALGREAASMSREEKAGPVEKDESRISITKLVVEGGLPEAVVRQVIEQNLSQLQKCYQELGREIIPHKITLRWSIGGNGILKDLQIAPKKGSGDALLDCFRKHVGGWMFPTPESEREVSVVLDLSIRN